MKQVFILRESENKIQNANDLFKRIVKVKIDFKQENLILICFNGRNDIIKSEVLFIGGLDSSVCDPKVIFRKALECNASKIVISHNHPSGNLKPSGEDLRVMNAIKEAGKMMGLELMDFIIFNKEEFYSCL